MRSAAALIGLIALASPALTAPKAALAADLSDIQTFLGEVAFDQVRVAPDGGRLAFVARRDDFEHDRELFTVWPLDLTGDLTARPVQVAEMESCSGLRWSPDGRSLAFLSGSQLSVLEPKPGAAARPLPDPARFPDGVDLYDWLPDGSGMVVEATGPPGEPTAGERRLPGFYGGVRRSPSPAPQGSLFRIALAGGRIEPLGAAPFEETESLAVS